MHSPCEAGRNLLYLATSSVRVTGFPGMALTILYPAQLLGSHPQTQLPVELVKSRYGLYLRSSSRTARLPKV